MRGGGGSGGVSLHWDCSLRAVTGRFLSLSGAHQSSPAPSIMSSSLSKRSSLANDNGCLGLSLALVAPPGGVVLPHKGRCAYSCGELQSLLGLPPSVEEPSNRKWVKEGQNQLRQAAERGRDQNRNEVSLPSKELSALLVPLTGQEVQGRAEDPEDQEEEEDEEEEEEEEGSTPVQSEPVTESEQSSERALPRGEQGRSASLLFATRNSTASDEDSSWATLSQGSPTGSSPDEAGRSFGGGTAEGRRDHQRLAGGEPKGREGHCHMPVPGRARWLGEASQVTQEEGMQWGAGFSWPPLPCMLKLIFGKF